MVRNRKERENPSKLLVAATLEKAITYVFAESPFRNAEARGSSPLCSTNNPAIFQIFTASAHLSLFFSCDAVVTWLRINPQA
jgi:hypothetical protein